jgi:hypothetical protein
MCTQIRHCLDIFPIHKIKIRSSESEAGGYKKSGNGSHHSFSQFQLSLPSVLMAPPVEACCLFSNLIQHPLTRILRTDLSQKTIMRKTIRMFCLNLSKNHFQVYPLKRVHYNMHWTRHNSQRTTLLVLIYTQFLNKLIQLQGSLRGIMNPLHLKL